MKVSNNRVLTTARFSRLLRKNIVKFVRGRYVLNNQYLYRHKSTSEESIERTIDDKLRRLKNSLWRKKYQSGNPFRYILYPIEFLFRSLENLAPNNCTKNIYRCCWDKSLYLISDSNGFNILSESAKSSGGEDLIVQEVEEEGFGMNELAYTIYPENANNNGGEDMIVQEVEEEGHDLLYQPCNRFISPNPCKNGIPIPFNPSEYADKTKVAILDLGSCEFHYEAIKRIIEDENPDAAIFDYNITHPTGVGTVFGICCQIARAISEGMQVINISQGFASLRNLSQNHPLVISINAAQDAGIVVTTSAGNKNLNNDIHHHWPSNLANSTLYNNIKNTLAIGSLGNVTGQTTIADFSSIGADSVTGYLKGYFSYNDFAGNAIFFGTSFSSGMMAGQISKYLKSKGYYGGSNNLDEVILKIGTNEIPIVNFPIAPPPAPLTNVPSNSGAANTSSTAE